MIDKSSIPVCPILGVNIAAINMPWLLKFTEKHIHEMSGDYITVANVHTTITAYEDETYRTIQNGGIMAIPDGGPLSSVGRHRGYFAMERVTGPSYMEEILRLSSQYGWKHYFYGSTSETIEKMRKTLDTRYPEAQIVGMYSPPFRAVTVDEDEAIVREINLLQPDFIWVGLGAPKQEIWMAQHQGRLSGLMVGVGAAFDYCAGNIDRAPQWMQRTNLEWLYRLLQEPRRLFCRYFTTNTKFIWHVIIRGR